ncbi:MAG: four helix bundle protein [Patescibacteria group bacterium]
MKTNETLKDFTQLLVWQQGHDLVLETYKVTKTFPREELFCLVSQMRRAAISITSNITEGFGRRSIPDKKHFYVIATGSASELTNQFMIAKDLSYLEKEKYDACSKKLISISKLLGRLISSLG